MSTVSPVTAEIIEGDCLSVMAGMPSASVDAVITDPPAGIAFMGKAWDSQRTRDRFVDFLAPRLAEARRLAKPGSYALVWALPRTSHWTALAIEDAGWVIRDRISHLFGTGFPKSKACLKPACEDWWLAWNPATKVTPLNVDACRIPGPSGNGHWTHKRDIGDGNIYGKGGRTDQDFGNVNPNAAGRWPANVTHDGSEEVMEAFAAFGEKTSGKQSPGGHVRNSDKGRNIFGAFPGHRCEGDVLYGDTGTAARFFYCAKASKSDRGDGNTHPTVKSTELMRWLCRLITPPGGTDLDPFCGSGSTGKAAVVEGFSFIGIEGEPEYVAIARKRVGAA